MTKIQKKLDLVTHPEKILYPDSRITKGDLANFYVMIHEWILPHVINRPLTLVRCPEGIEKECFFQKHMGLMHDKNIHIIKIKESQKIQPWMYIKDIEGLIALIQLGVLEIHCWGCQIDNIEKPDRIIFDLDPDEALKWREVQAAAILVKKQLKKIKLESFVKTSGNKGLHVVLPILPDWKWKEVKDFTHAIAQLMESEHPDIFISNMSKAKRKGKIFLDYLRNGRGATAVIAYSTRAKPHAPVSTPLRWDELTPEITSDFYNIQNLENRLKHLKSDPWEKLFTLDQQLKI